LIVCVVKHGEGVQPPRKLWVPVLWNAALWELLPYVQAEEEVGTVSKLGSETTFGPPKKKGTPAPAVPVSKAAAVVASKSARGLNVVICLLHRARESPGRSQAG
jgi:hypothetical protein